MRIRLLIPAAGMGRRLGMDKPKALAPLGGKSLLFTTLQRLLPLQSDAPAIVVFAPGHRLEFEKALETFPAPVVWVEGGEERQDSVCRGLSRVAADSELVAIHDAARPFASLADIYAALEAAKLHGAATLALPVTDTILRGDCEDFLQDTPDRACLWACQTPQVFQAKIIHAAYAWATKNKVVCTDDATLVKRAGFAVKLIRGTASNFKITTANDLLFANFLLERDLL